MPVEEETGTLLKGTKATVQSSVLNRTVIPGQTIQSSDTQKNKQYSKKIQVYPVYVLQACWKSFTGEGSKA